MIQLLCAGTWNCVVLRMITITVWCYQSFSYPSYLGISAAQQPLSEEGVLHRLWQQFHHTTAPPPPWTNGWNCWYRYFITLGANLLPQSFTPQKLLFLTEFAPSKFGSITLMRANASHHHRRRRRGGSSHTCGGGGGDDMRKSLFFPRALALETLILEHETSSSRLYNVKRNTPL